MNRCLPCRVIDRFKFRSIFNREPGWSGEIAESVVTCCVATGSPTDIGALLLQSVDATHHIIDAQHVVSDVVQAWGSRKQRNPVMPLVTAQKAHEVAQPVAYLKTKHINEKANHFLMVGGMQHDMADFLGYTLPA